MYTLLILMLERLGIIVLIAFSLTRLPLFQNMVSSTPLNQMQQYKAVLFFGVFGIVGTYAGLTFSSDTLDIDRWTINVQEDEAIANFRVIGVVLGGLLGGYKIGIGAGILAGLHRYMLGGYTALSCGVAAIIAGIFSAYFHKKERNIPLPKVFFIAATAEVIQMALILLLSRPIEKVIPLVQTIGLPMVLANGFGGALFMLIIQNVLNQEEKISANQAQLSFRIADQTLVHLRKGLNEPSAKEVCEILYRETKATAVSITNQEMILAHVGLGSDHHVQGSQIQTKATRDTIQSGKLIIANDKAIHCDNKDCPLNAVLVAPLKQRNKTIGTLKFYFESKNEINSTVKELILGLSDLLSNQLEIAEAEKKLQLAKEAEIMALQAQMRPHFLFNTLSAITSLIRTDPTKARKLLLALSHFLRQNVSSTTITEAPIQSELQHVKAYLEIEETRFSNRLKVFYDIDKTLLNKKIPPLSLQPIVENAIKHGLRNIAANGKITITIQKQDHSILVSVTDNGEGISEEKMTHIGKQVVPSKTGTGMAIYNINRRLVSMFGEKAKLTIESKPNVRTRVSFLIPE
ncbi:LytS/YhcK type 5TM receptor domain-containing protein [Ornithinibacillus halophilus]|uniref:histidine kinase n=1 Tax=Ornithinibacillus halophilus TaxID=930117 RepID=A0A1M5IIA6_9BACI|nr:LytS/YhcK type 5TM receptor domain-containing protein [Ornithinibacillus halophilus]SHG28114.1 two-component system, LytT family, sensor histidine kinase LytS [Ornithinibacillus halophilus]